MKKVKRRWTWEEWQAGRYRRRQIGKLVAPEVIRRKSSKDDKHLHETFNGERGPKFPTDEELKEVERKFSREKRQER